MVIIVFFGVLAFYLLMCVKVIKASERGVLISLGVPVRVLNPGPHFIWWLLQSVKVFSTTPKLLNLKVEGITTRNGIVKGYKEDGFEIEKTELDVEAVLTTYFSQGVPGLFRTVARCPGDSAKDIGQIVAPYIKDVVRSVFSEMPWILSDNDRSSVLAYITSKIIPGHIYFPLRKDDPAGVITKYDYFWFDFTNPKLGETAADMERYNPLVQLGLNMALTSLSITSIKFCDPELTKSITEPEKARFRADAAATSAERERLRILDHGFAAEEVARVKGINENVAFRKRIFDQADVDRKRIFDQADVDKKKLLDEKEGKRIGDSNDLDIAYQAGLDKAELTERQGIADAYARNQMLIIIEGHPDLEALRTLVEMAKGTSNTILYGLPAGMNDTISRILGGNKPEDILKFLKDPDVVKAIADAFRAITAQQP